MCFTNTHCKEMDIGLVDIRISCDWDDIIKVLVAITNFYFLLTMSLEDSSKKFKKKLISLKNTTTKENMEKVRCANRNGTHDTISSIYSYISIGSQYHSALKCKLLPCLYFTQMECNLCFKNTAMNKNFKLL